MHGHLKHFILIRTLLYIFIWEWFLRNCTSVFHLHVNIEEWIWPMWQFETTWEGFLPWQAHYEYHKDDYRIIVDVLAAEVTFITTEVITQHNQSHQIHFDYFGTIHRSYWKIKWFVMVEEYIWQNLGHWYVRTKQQSLKISSKKMHFSSFT